jgi:phosphoadenosine phosphosulfate reductase
MLTKLTDNPPPLIFLDTLHHFPETLNLITELREHYGASKFDLHTFTPANASNEGEFTAKYGANLWEVEPVHYDFVVKVEPLQRAFAQLNVKAILTGRRRDQGGKRGNLDIVEVDDAGMVKVNPLANWDFKKVHGYIQQHGVPTNALLKQGYHSVGDWHSTKPVKAGEDERSGRWQGQERTECGIHNSKGTYAKFLLELQAKERKEAFEAKLAETEMQGLKLG